MTPIRPSSLPALAVSPRFVAKPGGKAAMLGRDRHEVLENCFKANGDLLELLSPAEMEGVQWARDYITSVANLEDYPLQNEVPLNVYRGQTKVMQGTADAICGDHLFDMKWRRADYSAQMAAYALGLMQRRLQRRYCDRVTVHVLYAESKSLDRYDILKHDAENIVFKIVDNVQNPATVCATSRYCSWCLNAPECPILLAKVDIVENHLAKVQRLWSTETPLGLSNALTLAHDVERWVDQIYALAKDRALAGEQIPGYELIERNLPREIAPENINEAFQLLGLPVESFLKACKLSVAKLEIEVRESANCSLKTAEYLVASKLSDVIEERKTTKILSKTK